MEPHEYLLSLRKHWIVIVAVTVLGVVGAVLLNGILPVAYQAKSVVFVSASQGDTTTELVQGSTFTQNLVQSYAQLVSTPVVLQPVIDELGLKDSPSALAGSVSADAPLNTVLIDITVSDASASEAADIANSVADSLASVAERLSPSTADNTPAITMSVVTPAHTPTSPSSPNTRLIYISGLLIGLLLGVAYAVLRDLFDTRIRGDRDVLRVTALPILGAISRDRLPGVALLRDRQGRVADDFRRVRINLEFVGLDSALTSIVVTSATAAEGKTTTSINLALALAERDKRVLLIDADLRRPSVHRYTQIDGSLGLTSVLMGSVTLEEAVQPWGLGAIDVLPSGLIPPNPEQLLGSDAMIRTLAHAAESYDMIVLDSPPVLPVADTLSLSRLVDGVLVIARFGSTRRQSLSHTLESLASIQARVAGVVLNSVPTRSAKSGNYYGYGSEEELVAAGAALAESAEPSADGGVFRSDASITDMLESDEFDTDGLDAEHPESSSDTSDDDDSGEESAADLPSVSPVERVRESARVRRDKQRNRGRAVHPVEFLDGDGHTAHTDSEESDADTPDAVRRA